MDQCQTVQKPHMEFHRSLFSVQWVTQNWEGLQILFRIELKFNSFLIIWRAIDNNMKFIEIDVTCFHMLWRKSKCRDAEWGRTALLRRSWGFQW